MPLRHPPHLPHLQPASQRRCQAPRRRHPALKSGGAPNTIRLAARGKLLSVLINGQQVATAEDDAVSAAGSGALVVSEGMHVVAQRMKVGPSTQQDFAPPPAPPSIF